MKVLSIDVGIKNLAFCLFEKPTGADSYQVSQWDIINVSERDIVICGFLDKKDKCEKPAKFQKNGQCFCLKHSKKQQYKVPTSDLKSISKRKIQQLKELAEKHDIIYDPCAKKADLVDLINDHVKNNCFQPIHDTNASKVDLISIGYNIKHKFDQLFTQENIIDYVIIENQISPIANRMKTIQGMIAQYFIMSDVAVDKIEFVAASNKLKDCDEKDKSSYKARKQLGIKKCLDHLTTNNGFTSKIEYFDKHKKQDDLADSFLQELDMGNDFGTKKGTNFGGGIELLMNGKVKDGGGSRQMSDINLDDLNTLENELNDLVDDDPPSISFGAKSDLFNYDEKQSVRFTDSPRFSDNNGTAPSIGKSTAETADNTKTWDGYGKFNNIPMNPDKEVSSSGPQMSKEEMLREKFKILRKLEALEKKGVELTKKYSMESSLTEMQGEYETIMDEKSRQNSVKFQGNMLMAAINGIEFLNGRFDPFDIKIDGWSDQINENISDYDEIFGELHDKYKSKASMAPELKLLFQLGGSAMMVHMTNTMFKSAMPGMDDILRQNPDLMRSFQNAAVNSMSQTNPGFSGFMSNMMNPEPGPQYGGQGPPPPMATQGPTAPPMPMSRPGNNNYANRPDMNMSRSNFNDDGISMREKTKRPEMKGPSDITDILSGLKTKTINIQEQPKQQQSQQQSQQQPQNDSSTISISDLKDLQSDGNMPKRSGRRKKSASNTVSLDI